MSEIRPRDAAGGGVPSAVAPAPSATVITAAATPGNAGPQQHARPLATVLGSLLMLARAIAGFVFVSVSATQLTDIIVTIVREAVKDEPGASEVDLTNFVAGFLVAALVIYLIWHTVYFFLMVAVFRGSEVARVFALSFATVSIVLAFVATVSGGEEISFRTSLLSLALDVLILLALSGQDSRVFAREARAAKKARKAGRKSAKQSANGQAAIEPEPTHPEDLEYPKA